MSDSESDEEYVPGVPEQLSEVDSADDETESQYEQEVQNKQTKRKAVKEGGQMKKRIPKHTAQHEITDDKNEAAAENPEEDKEKEDELWAMFLGTSNKESKKPETKESIRGSMQVEKKDPIKVNEERKVFEFAGEKVVVENNKIVDSTPCNSSAGTASNTSGTPIPTTNGAPKPRSGLSAILSQIGKKNKLSTLEKTRLDWDTFKKKEGIEEEVKKFNKGKDGYLERQDFLERADLRQFELEKSLRASKRSNR